MQSNSFRSYRLIFAVALSLLASMASPVPAVNINSAVIKLRIFNDDPDSLLTFGDNYPASIFIQDLKLDGDGVPFEFANLHVWHLSENDLNDAVFNNNDGFDISSNLLISGTGNGEAGLQVTPWWSQDMDGRLMVRTDSGEVVAFGGRLPFYNFTGTYGLHYVKGDTIGLEIRYEPNSLTSVDPGTIEYLVTYNNNTYSSGVIPFDQGNPFDDPPYGLWGILNDARVGGFVQPNIGVGNPETYLRADWSSIAYNVPEPATWVLLIVAAAGIHLCRRHIA
ncbi:MAG TPA: PEP-CTERM sorting domain-containing protein [Thermoguttaceae bacterium]